MSYSDSTLVCAASAPHAANTSLIRSSPCATSNARRRISFSQEGQIQTGGGGDGSGWRGRGMTAAVPADGDRVRVCRIHKRQSFISIRERNLSRSGKLNLFGPNRGNSGIGKHSRAGTFGTFFASDIDVFVMFSHSASGVSRLDGSKSCYHPPP